MCIAEAVTLFRTLKYHPSLPAAGFASLEEARAWTHRFVQWYNHEHLHSSLRFEMPAQKHAGEDTAILARRAEVYRAAKARNPERWNGRRTRNWSPVRSTTLNSVSQRSLEPIAKRAA
jgi:putative transposase